VGWISRPTYDNYRSVVNACDSLLELRLLGVVESLCQQGGPQMPTHKYEEVANTLRDRIIDGTYPPGSRLPSRRDLCENFGVSGIVIDKAMRQLRWEGRTETLHGVGVFVTETSPDAPA
jgi:GntR family transcriptional regulator